MSQVAETPGVRAGGTREVILTSSERLAHDLQVDAALRMRQDGRRVWAAPEIHSFRRWTEREWSSCWPKEQILHPTQELALWLYAIEKSGAGERQLSRMAAARQARKIGNIVQAYRVDPDPGSFAGPEESLFYQWHTLVMETIAGRGWLLETQVPDALIALMESGEWTPPEQVRTIGMVHETPVQHRLLEAMAERGTVIIRDEVARECESELILVRPANKLMQMRMAAERIRDLLLPYNDRVDVEPPRIALVVPDLDAARPELDAVLGEYLAPYTLVPGELRERRSWRYARGLPLAEQPLVALALDLLSLEGRRNPLDLLSRILLDPSIFPNSSRTRRSEFELRLRQLGYWFSIPRMKVLAAEHADSEDDFAARFSRWLDEYDTTRPGRELPSVWADWIQAILAAAGWGSGNLTSTQTQAIESWNEALDGFRAMDSQIGTVNASQMLVWVREILFARFFQPAVRHLQPVHVLTHADALGGAYDEIIVLDATVGSLPEAPRAVGLVSQERMAQAGVPRSSPELAVADAERWRDVLLKMAPKIQVMAPAHDDAGGSLVPSPIFTGWPEETSVAEGETTLKALSSKVDEALEVPADEPVPPIEDPDLEGVRGGVAIFSAMAISPWKAFVRHRLGLSEFPVAVEGIDTRHQGKLMHRVLERFWSAVRSRDELLAIPTEDLVAMVHELVGRVQEEDGLISPEAFGSGLAAAEHQRMTELVLDWLEVEGQRTDPFEVVLTEAEVRTNIGGLNVSLRIDRVDRIDRSESGDDTPRYLAIDYKSQSQMSRAWLEADDLPEPQLPIYASCSDLASYGIPSLDGVAWAQVAEKGCAFITYAGFCDSLTPKTTGQRSSAVNDWLGQLRAWRSSLERQAAVFMGGSLELDRKKFQKDEYSKDLAPLIRPADETAPVPPNGDPF